MAFIIDFVSLLVEDSLDLRLEAIHVKSVVLLYRKLKFLFFAL